MVQGKAASTAGRRRAARGAIAFLAGLTATSVAAADAELARFAGDWVGRGTVRASADATPERVYCRLSNTLEQDGDTLAQEGRCAVGNDTAVISGRIVAEGGGRYSGTMATPQMDAGATLAGQVTGGSLRLEASYVDADSGQPATAIITLQPLDGGYQLVVARDGFQPTDIRFKATP